MKSLIGIHLLHCASRMAVRLAPPLDAMRIVRRCARWLEPLLEPLSDERTIGRHAESLENHGTCLTRAIAIAARVPRAEVVISVNPGAPRPYFAHAWVEIDGRPVRSEDRHGHEIARFGGDAPSGSGFNARGALSDVSSLARGDSLLNTRCGVFSKASSTDRAS